MADVDLLVRIAGDRERAAVLLRAVALPRLLAALEARGGVGRAAEPDVQVVLRDRRVVVIDEEARANGLPVQPAVRAHLSRAVGLLAAVAGAERLGVGHQRIGHQAQVGLALGAAAVASAQVAELAEVVALILPAPVLDAPHPVGALALALTLDAVLAVLALGAILVGQALGLRVRGGPLLAQVDVDPGVHAVVAVDVDVPLEAQQALGALVALPSGARTGAVPVDARTAEHARGRPVALRPVGHGIGLRPPALMPDVDLRNRVRPVPERPAEPVVPRTVVGHETILRLTQRGLVRVLAAEGPRQFAFPGAAIRVLGAGDVRVRAGPVVPARVGQAIRVVLARVDAPQRARAVGPDALRHGAGVRIEVALLHALQRALHRRPAPLRVLAEDEHDVAALTLGAVLVALALGERRAGEAAGQRVLIRRSLGDAAEFRAHRPVGRSRAIVEGPVVDPVLTGLTCRVDDLVLVERARLGAVGPEAQRRLALRLQTRRARRTRVAPRVHRRRRCIAAGPPELLQRFDHLPGAHHGIGLHRIGRRPLVLGPNRSVVGRDRAIVGNDRSVVRNHGPVVLVVLDIRTVLVIGVGGIRRLRDIVTVHGLARTPRNRERKPDPQQEAQSSA